MAIIIKGIDLPIEGAYKEIRIYSSGNVDLKLLNEHFATDIQAIQIDRPHGRLIDGDKLLKEYKQWLESVPYINNTMSEMGQRIVLIDICHDLEYSAPTILEAEGYDG